jgi:HEAT repeat protein
MRRKWLIRLAVLAALTGLILWLVRTPEPSYQGRSASAWLDLLGESESHREEVIAAFKAMGRDAAPFLARELERKPSWLQTRLWELNQNHPLPAWVDRRITEPHDHRAEAAALLRELGPDAEPALSVLLRIFHEGHQDENVLYAVYPTLGALGDKLDFMVPELTRSLIDGRPHSRTLCAGLLGDIGPKAKAAVPALEAAVKEGGWLARSAAWALLKIDSRTNLAIEVLTQCLDQINSSLRCSALADLRRLGPAAIPAAPRIQQALWDPEASVREVAMEALREIDHARLEQSVQQMNRDLPARVDLLTDIIRNDNVSQWWRAALAVAVIGPEAKAAVPALTDVLMLTSSVKLRLPGAGSFPPSSTMSHAAAALGEIGPDARDAVPVLAERVRDQEGRWKRPYCQALGRVGPAAKDALAVLRAELASEPPEVRLAAAVAITRIDSQQSRDAVQVLQGFQNHPEPKLRLEAATALWRLDPATPSPIAALIDLLKRGPEADKERAAELLGELGPHAKEAIPALAELVEDSSHWEDSPLWMARRAAAMAIRKIDLEAAARLGLPGWLAFP